jgi:hypothetical protein
LGHGRLCVQDSAANTHSKQGGANRLPRLQCSLASPTASKLGPQPKPSGQLRLNDRISLQRSPHGGTRLQRGAACSRNDECSIDEAAARRPCRAAQPRADPLV